MLTAMAGSASAAFASPASLFAGNNSGGGGGGAAATGGWCPTAAASATSSLRPLLASGGFRAGCSARGVSGARGTPASRTTAAVASALASPPVLLPVLLPLLLEAGFGAAGTKGAAPPPAGWWRGASQRSQHAIEHKLVNSHQLQTQSWHAAML